MASIAVSKAGYSLPQPTLRFVNKKEYLRRTSFYDLLDFKGTMDNVGEKVKAFNQNLKDQKIRKGRLRGLEKTTSILLKILIKEMEWYRKNNFDQYLLYMDQGTPTLPIYTNRGQISTMDNESPSLRTISTRIKKMMNEVPFITQKRNTSRVTLTKKDAAGKEYRVYKSMLSEKDETGATKVGRGDFRLQINKAFLQFSSIAVKDPKNTTPIIQISSKNKTTDNQRVTKEEKKSLQQPYGDSISETPITHLNSCGNSRSGIATQSFIRSAIADDDFYIGDERGKKIFSEKQKENPEFLKKILKKLDGRPRLVPIKNPKGQLYLDKFKKEKLLRENLPQNLEDHYSKILWALLINRLYPSYHQETVETISQAGFKLIKNHVERLKELDYSADAAYWIIARAIDKAFDFAQKNNFTFMHPLAYLRFDKNGSLINVIDKWVIEGELKLIKLKKESNQKLVEYQDAFLETEKLFIQITKAYKESYFDGKEAVINASDKLEKLFFIQKNLTEKMKIKIRKDFADKITILISNMESQATEFTTYDDDPVWENFECFFE